MRSVIFSFAVVIFFLFASIGCGESKDKGGPLKMIPLGPRHLPQKLSREDLKKTVLGRPRDEVVRLIGSPTTVWRNETGDEEWRFSDFVADPVAEVILRFDKAHGEVSEVSFSK